MRDFTNKFSSFYLLMVCFAGIAGFAGALVVPKAYAAGPGEKLVMIHDRGTERGVITRATTLRDVFNEAHIKLDKNDRVEPGLDENLVADQYQVNVYRAQPVVIVDGNVRQLVMSAYQTPKQIAKHAGIELRDEDQADVNVTSDFVVDGASVEMTVDRATPVQLTLYGKTNTVYTQASTVAGFLKEKHIKLSDKDDMSAEPNLAITTAMQLNIWRNGKQTITQEEDVLFDTETIKDVNRDVSFKHVDTPGVNGKKMVTYEIVMQDGHEVSRTVIQSVVTKQASKQVETVGAKEPALPAGSHTDWMQAGGISASDYGYVDYIFVHESGWNPAASNPAGYYGLGQTSLSNISGACPNWRTDPICQIRFFNKYAVSRYGSWSAAYQFKKSRGWW